MTHCAICKKTIETETEEAIGICENCTAKEKKSKHRKIRYCAICGEELETEMEKHYGWCNNCITAEEEEEYEKKKIEKMLKEWVTDD